MRSDAVDFLMGQPNGAQYVVLYQMLCLMTINTDGRLSRQIGEVIIPYDVDKIQRDTKWFSVDTVRVALGLYAKLGLIYQEQDGTLVLTNHSEMVGSETDFSAQKRRQRSNQREISSGGYGQCPQQCPPIVHQNVHTDIRDKEIRDRYKSSSSKDDSSYRTMTTTESILDFFRDSIGKLNANGKMELTGYIERLGAELTAHIVQKCADTGGNSWAYVRKALAEAEAQGCKSVEEYRLTNPIGAGRNMRVERAHPAGKDFLKSAALDESLRRLKKKGEDENAGID